MPISHRETRSQTVKIHFSDPSSTREWIIWGSRDRDEILAHLTFYNLPPAVDTVANIPRYLRDADLNEVGSGVWKYKANYCKNPNTYTIEINYTGGTQNLKQSLALVRAYNCDTEISSTTQDFADAASEANSNLLAGLSSLESSIPVLGTFIATAAYAADPDFVATTVLLLCFDTIDSATSAKNAANQVLQMATLVMAAVQNTINAEQGADPILAASSAALAVAHAATSLAASLDAQGEAADAASAAALAVSAAASENAESIDAAAAAANAGNSAESAAGYADDVHQLINAAKIAAQAVATAVVSDATGGIPNLGTMINVTDRGVDGVEIEDEKCEITITKHWVASTLASNYLDTLQSMAPCKNNAEFTINYKGQIVVYKAGELKFKNFTYRQDGDDSIDITYYLASAKNITTADNKVIGDSDPIEKEGWDYLSVLYVNDVDVAGFCKTKKPKAVYIHRVYRPMAFAPLQLF